MLATSGALGTLGTPGAMGTPGGPPGEGMAARGPVVVADVGSIRNVPEQAGQMVRRPAEKSSTSSVAVQCGQRISMSSRRSRVCVGPVVEA